MENSQIEEIKNKMQMTKIAFNEAKRELDNFKTFLKANPSALMEGLKIPKEVIEKHFPLNI